MHVAQKLLKFVEEKYLQNFERMNRTWKTEMVETDQN